MNLLDFLADLAKDPLRQLEFQRDPEGVARRAGVDEACIPALASRDSAALRALLAAPSESAMIYSPDSAMIYSPDSAMIYSPESAMIYSPESA